MTVYDVEVADGRKLTFAIEAAPPFRLVRQTGADGEELRAPGLDAPRVLDSSTHPGGEKYLKELG